MFPISQSVYTRAVLHSPVTRLSWPCVHFVKLYGFPHVLIIVLVFIVIPCAWPFAFLPPDCLDCLTLPTTLKWTTTTCFFFVENSSCTWFLCVWTLHQLTPPKLPQTLGCNLVVNHVHYFFCISRHVSSNCITLKRMLTSPQQSSPKLDKKH